MATEETPTVAKASDLEAIKKKYGVGLPKAVDEEIQVKVESTERRIQVGETPTSSPSENIQVISLTQATISCKISPRGTYSSVEISKTVDIHTENKEEANKALGELKREVLDETIRLNLGMIKKSQESGLL